MVGGFQHWKAHGRSVKKGEHSLMIWDPTGGKEELEELKEATDESKAKRAGFIMGTVFDVSQTEPCNERIDAGELLPASPC
jgi:hypothetical protein